MSSPGDPKDPRFTAAIDLLTKTGCREFQVRYHDDEEPTVWMAVGRWGETFDAAAAVNPLRAVIRLLETVMDGGTCTYCTKPTAISDDFASPTIGDQLVCWWVYDPELKKFRRGCEGEHDERQIKARAVGRNEPCPCGSGEKFKRCCGG